MPDRLIRTEQGTLQIPEAIGEPIPIKGCAVETVPPNRVKLIFYGGDTHFPEPGEDRLPTMVALSHVEMDAADFQGMATQFRLIVESHGGTV